MDASNISHLFQRSNFFTGYKATIRQADAPSDLIQQISSQIVNKQKCDHETDSTSKASEIRMDTYDREGISQPLEEMAQGALKYYLQVTKIFASSSIGHERDLLDFKERLQEMDRTIQGYQDILNGESALPTGLETDDIIRSLAKAMANREEFVRNGVTYLNKWSSYFVTSDFFDEHMKKILGENKFAGKDCSTWMLNSASSDIYSEIDRVLSETRNVTKELDRGIKKIYDALVKYESTDKYKDYLESRSAECASHFDQVEAKSIQQLIFCNLLGKPLNETQNWI